jgi:hypothetical protein
LPESTKYITGHLQSHVVTCQDSMSASLSKQKDLTSCLPEQKHCRNSTFAISKFLAQSSMSAWIVLQ